MVTEAEKSHDLPPASQRPGGASGGFQSEPQRLRTGAAWCQSWSESGQRIRALVPTGRRRGRLGGFAPPLFRSVQALKGLDEVRGHGRDPLPYAVNFLEHTLTKTPGTLPATWISLAQSS